MKRLSFGKDLRLLDSSEFNAVFEENQYKVSSAELLILARLNQRDHPRIGLVVAKKHIRKACHRNLAKRVIRESFRQHQQSLPPCDLVVLVRKGLADRIQQKEKLHESIEPLWKKLIQKHENTEEAQ